MNETNVLFNKNYHIKHQLSVDFSNKAPNNNSEFDRIIAKIEMSRDHLLSIITRWKNEAYDLSRQLELIKNDYRQKLIQTQYENNSRKTLIHSPLIKNEDILKQLLINVDQSSISDQLSALCQFFVDSLKTLLLSNIKKEKERSTTKYPSIIETIETNIKQIGNLINKMNEDCSNELIKQ